MTDRMTISIAVGLIFAFCSAIPGCRSQGISSNDGVPGSGSSTGGAKDITALDLGPLASSQAFGDARPSDSVPAGSSVCAPPLTFDPIPDIVVPALGQKITPVDLSQYAHGGTAPYDFPPQPPQTAPEDIACDIAGTLLVSDYSYHAGTSTVTVTVIDANGATAQTPVRVIVSPPVPECMLYGIDFSPYVGAQTTTTTVGVDQLIQQVGAIATYFESIRTYGCSHGLENIPMIAKRFGLRVYAGMSICGDDAANQIEIQNCIANANYIDAAIVGNEVVARYDGSILGAVSSILPGSPPTSANSRPRCRTFR